MARGLVTVETARRIRFQQHPEMTACWIWTGRIGTNDCPAWHYQSRPTTARLAVWRQLRNQPATGLTARCDNRLCVNPNHMDPQEGAA